MPTTKGLYEEIISQVLLDQLTQDQPIVDVTKEALDPSEAPSLLARHVAHIIEATLRTRTDDLDSQVRLVNSLIEGIQSQIGDSELLKLRVATPGEILLAIGDRVDSGRMSGRSFAQVRPATGLSQSALLTGTGREPIFASELKKEIRSADRIDMLVSFIMWSGILQLSEALLEFTSRPNARLRILTTTYMRASDFKAIEFLSGLPNTEVRISFDENQTRLHAKAYMFQRETGFTTAYVGSSNLSRTAITNGLEWNVKLTAKDSPHIINKFEATFETIWQNRDFEAVNQENLEKVRNALSARPGAEIVGFVPDIYPYPFQEEILEKLQAERELHGHTRNLVVAATGTGKTVVSALDYRRFCNQNRGQRNRLLFVAHRKEILEQSRRCFRQVLRDFNFGDLQVGEYEAGATDHLFVSIQSFNSRNLTEVTSPEFYDFIVVDEFHHAKAESYQQLLSYYRPKVLLGLTATPERLDGRDILEYFDGRIAAEIRLFEAMNRGLLAPFQYFGVSDSVSYEDAWRAGRYDVNALEDLLLENSSRAELVVNSVLRYVANPNEVSCVGFCATVSHAAYMAGYFKSRGLKAEMLSGQSPPEERQSFAKKLAKKEINFLFVVDIFNEGVDIPEIDTILFLRPTESLTVFLQQLGRGLRKCEGKECLTVLDFIGQSHKNYSFESKFQALIGRTSRTVRQEIEDDFPHAPAGCYIQLERQAKEYVLTNVAVSLRQNMITSRLKTFEAVTGKDLTLANFIEHFQISVTDLYSKACWNRHLVNAGLREGFEQADEDRLTKGIRRLSHINSRRLIRAAKELLVNPQADVDHPLRLMLHYSIWGSEGSVFGMRSLKESVDRVLRNDILSREFLEVLDVLYDDISFVDRPSDLPYECPLDLHCQYTRDEILAGLGYYSFEAKPAQREGVLYIEPLRTDVLFVTLNKAEKDYSPTTLYEDYPISESKFHWQSQSTTSTESVTGKRYLKQNESGSHVLLFVRENKTSGGLGAPYCFLGPVKYNSHYGSKPISIVWDLEHPMPPHLLKDVPASGI